MQQVYRIFPRDQAIAIAERLASDKRWWAGKARTAKLTGTVKQNDEIVGDDVLLQQIGRRILSHPDIAIDIVPYQAHAPKFSRYMDGQHYARHTDAPWMNKTRTDLSCTLFLSDPTSYEDGALVVGGTRWKPDAGEAVVYDCGDIHEVLPVTAGARICAVTWIQSRIRDPHRRRIVADMRRMLSRIEDSEPDAYLEASRIHSALLRMWSET